MDAHIRQLQRDGDEEGLKRALARIGREALNYTGPVEPPEVIPVKIPREISRQANPSHGGRHNYVAVKKGGKSHRSRGRRREGRASCRLWEELY